MKRFRFLGIVLLTAFVATTGHTREVRGDKVFAGEISSPHPGFADSQRMGVGATAAGARATAYGDAASADFASAVAIGHFADVRSFDGVCVGAFTVAGNLAVALGHQASAASATSVALGAAAQAVGVNGSISVGRLAVAQGASSIALGIGSKTTHSESIAVGNIAVSTAPNRFTIGTIGGTKDKELQIGLGFAEFGATPPSSQPAAIADVPIGGSATAAANATAINAMLALLRARGTLAP